MQTHVCILLQLILSHHSLELRLFSSSGGATNFWTIIRGKKKENNCFYACVGASLAEEL